MTDIDADYLVHLEARSSIVGFYYFKNRMIDYSKGNPNPNGPILKEWKPLKTVVSSSDEAETCGTFENEKNVIPLRQITKTDYLHQQPIKGLPIIIPKPHEDRKSVVGFRNTPS